MHICLLTPSFPPMVDGGVAIATGRLVQCLLQRGHQITVVTTAPPAHLWGSPYMPPRWASPEWPCTMASWRTPYVRRQPWRPCVSGPGASIEREPFDVILAYFVYPAGYLATVLGELLGVPVVCSCRGNDISKEMFITPEITAAVLTRSTRLIFVSTSLLHMADTLVPCRAKATVIANAVDSAALRPRRLNYIRSA